MNSCAHCWRGIPHSPVSHPRAIALDRGAFVVAPGAPSHQGFRPAVPQRGVDSVLCEWRCDQSAHAFARQGVPSARIADDPVPASPGRTPLAPQIGCATTIPFPPVLLITYSWQQSYRSLLGFVSGYCCVPRRSGVQSLGLEACCLVCP